ncbi:MAG: peptide deformylase, partial [Deltaproteobacteria bacterium]|nr:peptide deformylase [Deltaproteobacteria bacterium]
MSLKEIIRYPNPVIRKKSEFVEEVNEEIKQLMEDMTDTMYASCGVGLAAVQIG